MCSSRLRVVQFSPKDQCCQDRRGPDGGARSTADRNVIVALTVAYKYREARSLPKNTGINLNTA